MDTVKIILLTGIFIFISIGIYVFYKNCNKNKTIEYRII